MPSYPHDLLFLSFVIHFFTSSSLINLFNDSLFNALSNSVSASFKFSVGTLERFSKCLAKTSLDVLLITLCYCS